jgi:plasmid stabilization system protein ParE
MASRQFKILLTPRARRDLEEIAQYTQHQWGPEQTRRYMQELDDTMQQLRATPSTIGTNRDGVKSIPTNAESVA